MSRIHIEDCKLKVARQRVAIARKLRDGNNQLWRDFCKLSKANPAKLRSDKTALLLFTDWLWS